jgi:C-terminal processing protease CtpA/Prc
MAKDTRFRIEVKGEDLNGKIYQKTLMLKVGDEATGKEKLAGIGIELREEDGKILVDNVVFSSRAEKAGIDFDQEILNIQVPSQRPPHAVDVHSGDLALCVDLVHSEHPQEKGAKGFDCSGRLTR